MRSMEIKTQIESGGKTYKVIYRDEDPSTNLNDSTLHGVHAYCFYKDKLVVVLNSKNLWTPPGGAIEKGETYEEAIIREVREEANMKVLYQHYIGYQDVWFEKEKMMSRQARVFCIVEPFGNFENDPDGDISEIKLLDPKDYKEYIAWGEIGDHLMTRALEMKKSYDAETFKLIQDL